jgi:hypothetical protein
MIGDLGLLIGDLKTTVPYWWQYGHQQGADKGGEVGS